MTDSLDARKRDGKEERGERRGERGERDAQSNLREGRLECEL